MSWKSIHIISSYTVSKLGRFFETQCSTAVWNQTASNQLSPNWGMIGPTYHVKFLMHLRLCGMLQLNKTDRCMGPLSKILAPGSTPMAVLPCCSAWCQSWPVRTGGHGCWHGVAVLHCRRRTNDVALWHNLGSTTFLCGRGRVGCWFGCSVSVWCSFSFDTTLHWNCRSASCIVLLCQHLSLHVILYVPRDWLSTLPFRLFRWWYFTRTYELIHQSLLILLNYLLTCNCFTRR